MRISGWSSDVCSSDLAAARTARPLPQPAAAPPAGRIGQAARAVAGAAAAVEHARGRGARTRDPDPAGACDRIPGLGHQRQRSEEHTSELQSLMRISYAVFCLKKKNTYEHDQYKLTPQHTHH